jgi:hypothetical protein
VVSLHDSWQAGRKQRQQEVIDRQQHVRHTLDSFQQERQARAAEMREELRLFQLGLQLETHDLLATATAQRQAQAAQLTQHLQAFVQTLREQTAELISLNAADRSIMAQQLAQELGEFHGNLTTSVALLRQTLERQMQEIRQDVRISLQANRQERIRNHLELMQALNEWMGNLRSSVQTYLAELELVRQERAQQLHLMLWQERDRRTAVVNELFQELAQFRGELAEYCAELRQSVWGNHTAHSPAVTSTQPAAKIPTKPIAKSSIKSVAKKAPNTSKKQTTRPIASATTLTSASASAKTQTAAPTTVAASPPPISLPTESLITSVPSAKPEPSETQIEKDIYTHIHQTKGARLTELETALGINRFQAVDALRSLIKKGLVTQRDRMYLIQEDINL